MINQLKLASVVGLLLMSSLGCGKDDGRVNVSGSVQLDGKPLEGATVAFVGGGGGALASASTNKDGKFIIKAALGPNKVSINKPNIDPNAVAAPAPSRPEDLLMGPVVAPAKSAKNAPKVIPSKYTTPDSSGISYDIVSGMQPIEISILSD